MIQVKKVLISEYRNSYQLIAIEDDSEKPFAEWFREKYPNCTHSYQMIVMRLCLFLDMRAKKVYEPKELTPAVLERVLSTENHKHKNISLKDRGRCFIRICSNNSKRTVKDSIHQQIEEYKRCTSKDEPKELREFLVWLSEARHGMTEYID